MRLLLIRHGQTTSNVRRLLDTAAPGPGLTPLGEAQAAALPRALAAEDIGALYASPLIRTQLTAAPLALARGLEVTVRDGIRELSAGRLEMLPGDAPEAESYMRTAFAWAAGHTALRVPGGESGEEALGRYDAVIEEAYRSGADTVALVSHGAAIRMWTAARARNIDVAFAAARPLANTGVITLEGDPGTGWRALTWEAHTVEPPGTPGPTGEPLGTTG
ncbi:histidine phosphatase family protein [Streptomyces griseofuscus]|uniref:Histidine phosphatase family protein n=1 Tax=Streptomyces griseofuscus TaxID=146922 RepID=A0A3R8QFH8_9ACTN|nr:histidine phosphatase family protein [Streptomyces griseofuscus]RRQ76144.1 histidine phosphatase family protein [Streptomyces griseofuscus]RRQ84442.1 histidine phosphatase family protein [Streptomyces griseofuscus]